jgi:hypothetical protein
MKTSRGASFAVILLLSGRALSAADSPVAVATAAPAAEVVKVTPYGTVYFSGFSNSSATNNADIPMWALAGPANASATVRGSRFGFKVAGTKIGTAALSGIVEADFYGGFPAVGIGDNMGVIRVRLASARLAWEHTSVVIGQDWMVFAPANPVSIACTGIPLMAASGNPWSRLPQIRVEQKTKHVLLQAAVLAPSTGDFSSTFLAQPSSGGLSRLPFGQARIALKGWGTKEAGILAISGQVGRSRFVPASGAIDVSSNAVAADWNLPVGASVFLSGEAFTGKSLGGFQSGIFQGINTDFGTPPATGTATGTPTAIRTKGGWAQLGLVPSAAPKLGVYATFGLDDPDDADLVSVAKHDWRLKNTSVAGSVIYKLSPQLSLGAEVRHVETRLLQTGKQKNTHVNVAAGLSF